MFILIHSLNNNGTEKVGQPIVPPVPNQRHDNPGHRSGNDGFKAHDENDNLFGINTVSNQLSPVFRELLELIQKDPGISSKIKSLIAGIIFNPQERRNFIGNNFGDELLQGLDSLSKEDQKKSQQIEMLMALVAIPEPTQIIGAINSMKGSLLPDVVGLAEGMLAQARDFAQWLAEHKAKEGDSSAAKALYAAELKNVGVLVSATVQSFIVGNTQVYSLSDLASAEGVAEVVQKKKQHQVAIGEEITQLQEQVANENNPTQQTTFKNRLGHLKSIATG